jgi:hypothetical protein
MAQPYFCSKCKVLLVSLAKSQSQKYVSLRYSISRTELRNFRFKDYIEQNISEDQNTRDAELKFSKCLEEIGGSAVEDSKLNGLLSDLVNHVTYVQMLFPIGLIKTEVDSMTDRRGEVLYGAGRCSTESGMLGGSDQIWLLWLHA